MQDWTWSYSRIKCFEQCPYEFFMKYILNLDGKSNFYAEFGSFMHDILRQYHSGILKKNELTCYYVTHFKEEVTSDVSPGIRSSYFIQGLDYLESVKELNHIIGCEKEFSCIIGGYNFTGFADLIYQDESGVVIRDHKSKMLKAKIPNKKRKTDDELDEYLIQLYLYSNMFRQECGVPADHLEFNCFRSGDIIREQRTETGEMNAVMWVKNSIRKIMTCESFKPNIDYFYCKNLCNMRDQCEYVNEQ